MFVLTKDFSKKSLIIMKKYFVSIITTLVGWLEKFCSKPNNNNSNSNNKTEDAARKNHFLLLPYKREKGEHHIKSMKRRIWKLLLPEIKMQVAYTGRKVSTCCNLKFQSKFEHQHDVVYYADWNIQKITLVKVDVEFQNA